MAPAAPAMSSSSRPCPPSPPKTETSTAAVSSAMATLVGGASAFTATTKLHQLHHGDEGGCADADAAGQRIVLQDHLGAGGAVDGVQVRDHHLRPCRVGLHHDGRQALAGHGLGCRDFVDGGAGGQCGDAHHQREVRALDRDLQDLAAFLSGQCCGLAEHAQHRQPGGSDGFVVLHEFGQAVQVHVERAALERRGNDAPDAMRQGLARSAGLARQGSRVCGSRVCDVLSSRSCMGISFCSFCISWGISGRARPEAAFPGRRGRLLPSLRCPVRP